MSFICDNCGKPQRDRRPQNKVIIDYRKKVYPVRKDENEIVIDKGGHGWEIVKEAGFCNTCYANSMVKGE